MPFCAFRAAERYGHNDEEWQSVEKMIPVEYGRGVRPFYIVLQGRHDFWVMPFPVSFVHPEG